MYMYMYICLYFYIYTYIKWSAQTRLETARRLALKQCAEKVRWLEKGRKLEPESDAMDNIIVPLYHMRCYLANVRVVHEGEFVSRIF